MNTNSYPHRAADETTELLDWAQVEDPVHFQQRTIERGGKRVSGTQPSEILTGGPKAVFTDLAHHAGTVLRQKDALAATASLRRTDLAPTPHRLAPRYSRLESSAPARRGHHHQRRTTGDRPRSRHRPPQPPRGAADAAHRRMTGRRHGEESRQHRTIWARAPVPPSRARTALRRRRRSPTSRPASREPRGHRVAAIRPRPTPRRSRNAGVCDLRAPEFPRHGRDSNTRVRKRWPARCPGHHQSSPIRPAGRSVGDACW